MYYLYYIKNNKNIDKLRKLFNLYYNQNSNDKIDYNKKYDENYIQFISDLKLLNFHLTILKIIIIK